MKRVRDVVWGIAIHVILAACATLATAGTLACSAEHFPTPSLVTRARVLVVVAEPPEARPGETVRLFAVVASPNENRRHVVDEWAFCTTAPPPGAANSVAAECRTEAAIPIATNTLDVETLVPRDACRRFGPDPPPGEFRARDPDATGGFYQPIRLRAFGELWFHFLRVRCPLPDAPDEAARAFATDYIENRNPRLAQLLVTDADDSTDAGQRERFVPSTDFPFAIDASTRPRVVRANSAVQLSLGWDTGQSEPYAWFDPSIRALAERREAFSVASFATAGSIAPDWSRVQPPSDPDVATTELTTTWLAPSVAGPVSVWSVLRDERGGATLTHTVFEVAEE